MPETMHATVVPTFDKKDIEENKIIACLSYLSFLFLVPLLGKKDSKFCQEHAKQGLVIVLTHIALFVVGVVPILGWAVGLFGSVALLIADIIALAKCTQGEFWEIPVIGKYRNNFKI